MKAHQDDWLQTRVQWLNERVAAYPRELQPVAEVSYVQNALVKLTSLPEVQVNFISFQTRVDRLLDRLPPVEKAKSTSFSSYTQELSAFKDFIRQTYNCVPKGYYKKKWLLIGLMAGVFYWLLFKNWVVGIILGLLFGLMIGGGKDKKAEAENRVL